LLVKNSRRLGFPSLSEITINGEKPSSLPFRKTSRRLIFPRLRYLEGKTLSRARAKLLVLGDGLREVVINMPFIGL
jgi:hypothetical protein